ncbi:MAG TPA: GNAT family N-acetyltransferase [Pyrinomonadaceae bacterium]|nr:GNAT family N-acetyltransferase [Pyrinomonadaceae bacterium]
MSHELPSMNVRTVEHGDRTEWLRLLRGLYPHHQASEHIADIDAFLAGQRAGRPPLAAVFVCTRPGGGLAGLLELSVREYAEGCAGSTPYVESWFVDRDWRGRGVGGRLMAAAEAWAREQGHRELASDTLLDNERSLRAHRALGFEEVERSIHLRKSL